MANSLVRKLKGAAVGATIGLAALTAGANKADATTISSFYDLRGSGVSRDIRMDTDWETWADNLMTRDPVTKTDSVVNGVYHLGFLKYAPQGASVVGYANNDPTQEGMEGFMSGWYCTGLGEGQRPDDVWAVYDRQNNGIGDFDFSTGKWALGADDTLYRSQDILFGPDHIRGDVSQLPSNSPGDRILPHMVIDPVPEPATAGLLALGAGLALARKKTKLRQQPLGPR